jgi:hypothetical protein
LLASAHTFVVAAGNVQLSGETNLSSASFGSFDNFPLQWNPRSMAEAMVGEVEGDAAAPAGRA